MNKLMDLHAAYEELEESAERQSNMEQALRDKLEEQLQHYRLVCHFFP